MLEYQAKALFAEAGLPVPRGELAEDPQAARRIAESLGGRVVVKAQVPIGGRGKAGGIAVVETPDDAEREAARILGLEIRGYPVRRLLVEEAADIQDEYYLGITMDRSRQAPVLILSAAGGVDIEEVAEQTPERVAKVWLDPAIGLRPFHIRQAAYQAGIPNEALRPITQIAAALYRLMKEHDAILAEINPCARLADGRIAALDGKMEIDENAVFRQEKLASWKEDEDAEHPLEVEAKKRGLAYVKLDGEVGIIGNGAGLVMTTLDMIQRQGGRPANFLDIGGGAQSDVVRSALEIVLSDPGVRSALINVFGGITRCDEVAKGLLAVLSEMDVKIPLVVRLAGTRAEEGRALLEGSRLTAAETFTEAAEKAVAAAREGSRS